MVAVAVVSVESMMITFNVIYIVVITSISFVLSSIFDRWRKEIFERGNIKKFQLTLLKPPAAAAGLSIGNASTLPPTQRSSPIQTATSTETQTTE